MKKLKKWIQRIVINAFLFYQPPLIVVLFCVFGLVFFIGYYCAHVIDQIDIVKYQPYSSLYDNIAGSRPKNWMPDIFPIDVIYTWVNGSDPLLLRDLKIYGNLKEKISGECSYKNCFSSPYYIIEKTWVTNQVLQDSDYIKLVKELAGTNKNATRYIFTLTQHATSKSILDIKNQLNISCKNQLFWTSGAEIAGALSWKQTFLYVSVGGNSSNYLNKIGKECNLYSKNDLVVVECNDLLEHKYSTLFNESKTKVKTLPAYLTQSKTCQDDKDNNLKRYSDNEELKYSLRSVETYMPWVRRIFIVTNGQIPHWLNLAHSRMTIVTHAEIFRDSNHLPTFSSGAIEANIHRIPGLSEHYIYFNDDFFLGAPVWPEDFYSPSDGYKIYLSWHLPECSPGCHSSWVMDNYCDNACNTSKCNYDGGDCLHDRDSLSEVTMDALSPISDDCSILCTDAWLSDSFCDTTCNVTACGFDCGDCGMKLIRTRLSNLTVPTYRNETISAPQGELAVWLDLSKFMNESRTDAKGNFTSSAGVRKLVINKDAQTAIFIFRENFTDVPTVNIFFTQRSPDVSRTISFRLHYNTFPKIPEETLQVPSISNLTFPQKLNNDTKYSINDTYKLQKELSYLKRQYDNGDMSENVFMFKKSNLLKSLNVSIHVADRKLLWNGDSGSSKIVGKFMWERKGDFDEDVVNFIHNGRRRLLDMFGESLQYVNRLYNKAYGFQFRKVPAHVPYFINKTIMEELVNRYSSAFDITSEHKFRSSNDMQLSFSYYHYIMSETNTRSVDEIFSIIDTDKSGTWADRELRTFMARSKDLPVYFSDLIVIQQELINCSKNIEQTYMSTPLYERYPDSSLPIITEQVIANCRNSNIEERLKTFEKRAKFKFKIVSDRIWHFIMISSNVSEVVRSLDELRKQGRKFICINNDMETDSADNEIIKALLSDFYESVLPIPSSFELPENFRNKFCYMDQLVDWKWRRNLFRALIWASVSCLLLMSCISCFNKQIEATKRKWCKQMRKIHSLSSA